MSGAAGADALDDGGDDDTLRESADADMTLTDTALTGVGGDSLVSVERGALTGGASGNQIDTSSFTGPVTVDAAGGEDKVTSGGDADLLELGAVGADGTPRRRLRFP